jgi:hypothetical protein
MHADYFGKAKRKISPGRSRRRGVDDIELDLRNIGWSGVDCIDRAQDKEKGDVLMYTAMSLQVPDDIGNFLSISTIFGS